MIARRTLLGAIAILAAVPAMVGAQQTSARVYRLGFLGSSSAARWSRQLEALRAGLREHGYIEGKNVLTEYRWAEGNNPRLPELASELVRLKVDLIITHGTPGTLAAKQATTAIPIVMATSADAVGLGLVSSLARPGGNITGLTLISPEIVAKRVELLKEAFPRVAHVAFLVNADNPGATGPTAKAVEATARATKLRLQQVKLPGSGPYATQFAAMAEARVDAIVVSDDALFVANAKTFAELAAKHGMLSAGGRDFVEAGGVIGYGVDQVEMYRRAAYFVHKILQGTKPETLPVERASKFEFVVNARAAKALGAHVPQSVLFRADKVIE